MKIRKSSWHYKIVEMTSDGNVPANLCGYFWRLVLGLVAIASLLGMLGFIGWLTYEKWPWSIIAIGVTVLVFGSIMWAFGLCSHLPNRPSSEPGLFRQWLKAKKDKVCPLIEYVE